MTPSPPATLDDAHRLVVDAVLDIAPDLDAAAVTPEAELRQDLDLDSMDFINLLAALSERLGIDIPERDYDELDSVGSCASYLHARARQS